MRRWVQWIAITLAAVAALYVVVGSVGAAVLLGYLLTPGNVDWSGANRPAPGDPFELGYRGDPKQALGYDFETVRYPTDGGEAEAWLVPAEGGPPGLWAVYVHGIGGIRENGYRQLSILHEAGIPVLMITYRNDTGAPQSNPAYFSFGLGEWRDLDAAVGWILEKGATDIILAAESMGGAIAGQFLIRSDKAGAIKALALDAPALDLPKVIEGAVGGLGAPFPNVIGAGALFVTSVTAPVRLSDAVSLDAVAAFPGPVFLAHGTADRLVPVSLSDRLVEKRTQPTTYVRTGAEHLGSYKEDPERYRAEMLEFLRLVGAR